LSSCLVDRQDEYLEVIKLNELNGLEMLLLFKKSHVYICSLSRFEMKIAIMYPNTESARLLAARLLESGNEVTYYCPDRLDLDFAQNQIFELNIIGKEQNELHQRENSFSVQSFFDLSDCHVIGETFKYTLLVCSERSACDARVALQTGCKAKVVATTVAPIF
jgi:hypothetical protein